MYFDKKRKYMNVWEYRKIKKKQKQKFSTKKNSIVWNKTV